jgi:TatD DNase family protein
MKYYDVHTHTISSDKDIISIISIDPYKKVSPEYKQFNKDIFFSIGIHPWRPDKSLTDIVSKVALENNVVAIGETGLDNNYAGNKAELDLQTELFRFHIELSEKLNKPLIIHCVKAWDQLLKIKNETKPSVPWIIHGFRGKPGMAVQLIKSGLYLSFGERYNIESVKAVWLERRLLLETDDKPFFIGELYKKISDDLNIKETELIAEIREFFSLYF